MTYKMFSRIRNNNKNKTSLFLFLSLFWKVQIGTKEYIPWTFSSEYSCFHLSDFLVVNKNLSIYFILVPYFYRGSNLSVCLLMFLSVVWSRFWVIVLDGVLISSDLTLIIWRPPNHTRSGFSNLEVPIGKYSVEGRCAWKHLKWRSSSCS